MRDITIITPHRDRTEQLELVIDCVNKQTLKPDKWIIVDDGLQKVPQSVLAKSVVPLEYVWYPRKYIKSASENSLQAMKRVTTKSCIVIQDDDYYPPVYLQTVAQKLQNKQNILFGNLFWYIYRLSTGHYAIRNGKEKKPRCGVEFQWHSAGFTGQGIKRALITSFELNRGKALPPDLLAQKTADTLGFPVIVQDLGKASCISLKDYGIGQPGWVSDHRKDRWDTKQDTPNFDVFKSWIGQDWAKYQKFLGRSL